MARWRRSRPSRVRIPLLFDARKQYNLAYLNLQNLTVGLGPQHPQVIQAQGSSKDRTAEVCYSDEGRPQWAYFGSNATGRDDN